MNKKIKLNRLQQKLKNLSLFDSRERPGKPGYVDAIGNRSITQSFGGSFEVSIDDDNKVYINMSSRGAYGICKYEIKKYNAILEAIKEYNSKIEALLED